MRFSRTARASLPGFGQPAGVVMSTMILVSKLTWLAATETQTYIGVRSCSAQHWPTLSS